jgi:hypothetical protein
MENMHLYIAISVCVLLITIVIAFSYWQVIQAKRYVNAELVKFATLVNDAQYNEFLFDKRNEQNIRNMDEKIEDIDERLKVMSEEYDTTEKISNL